MSIRALLVALLAAGKCIGEPVVSPWTANRDLSTDVDVRHNSYRPAPVSNAVNGLDLLDIVLVASIDGRLHALNRTSGDFIWSMKASSGTEPATLGPLVRTKHPDIDPDITDDGSALGEVYLVEPQSGDIYIMSTPDSPLQRLPFSMPQLVDMSPFIFPSDDDGRMFVGRKETSLLLVELETGRVKTMNHECPWDPFQDLAEPAEFDLDLDDLEGSDPPKRASSPTEVFIGRTDYHIAIHTRPSRASPVRPPVQNLSFSVYGPNNQDLSIQSVYRRTADNAYIQPLPNGEIISFTSGAAHSADPNMEPTTEFAWGRAFSTPIVAVFDILRSPQRQQPLALLQPRLHLEDILPSAELQKAAARQSLPFDAAFVGIVEETGSLFAMGPDTYPLVIFGDAGLGRFLDAAPRDTHFDDEFGRDQDLPEELDSVARRAKERRLRKMCREGSTDLRCLTGVRRLEAGTQSRFSRLLDAAPSESNANANAQGPQERSAMSAQVVLDPDQASAVGASNSALFAFAVCALALLVAFVWTGLRRKSSKPSPLNLAVVAGSQEREKPVEKSVEEHAPDALPPTESNAVQNNPALVNSPVRRRTMSTASRPGTPRPSTPNKRPSDIVLLDPTADLDGDAAEGDESEKDGETEQPAKRKGVRRKRGKKKRGGTAGGGADDEKENGDGVANDDVPNSHANGKADIGKAVVHVVSESAAVVPPPSASTPVMPSLIVSDTILGFGSHGTVVYKGSLQGRAVAVKRLLQDFVTLASREVDVLQESDDHPNVIRYYYQESRANFLYIALELCPASLADVIERPDEFQEIVGAFDPKRALRQVTAGLRHLHALKIIHRDIKPQNILISHAKRGAGHRMLISDFGLCKKLDVDQTSFLPTAHGVMAAGTVGWRAPEILRGEVKLDDTTGDDSHSGSSRGSVGTPRVGTPTGRPTRLTKSVDIFALGCLYYYVLTNGGHPFGDRFEREVNILKNAKSLEGLQCFGEEGSEAADLISRMLSPEAYDRPDTTSCLLHPYFWDPGKRLTFLQDASDRFEIMCRDPRDSNLTTLEMGAAQVVGNDWHSRLDKLFIENLGKFRKYDGKSVQDLLRALRNKKHHYQDLPDNVKRLLGSMPEGFLAYFTRRFPNLFLHVHRVVADSSLRTESMFRTYFDLSD
ncbi:hypothetical protein DAEQUDRAFT_718191 [Daedalea quercina L-15889]|uniref:non-specific serine/threonine protein kinase n=1 Tax=Daedalea quercina L-15889 TaxID=1314783 RepID=A0A165LF18_9APHY|nr:hypothetical protein DAEQUDRAFT_718191 [Daedalea quercina L-15889]